MVYVTIQCNECNRMVQNIASFRTGMKIGDDWQDDTCQHDGGILKIVKVSKKYQE